MSAKSRKISSRKSLLKNSPLITPSNANKRSKKISVAFEFECDSISSSQSSVFTDNETNITKKKKRTGRTKKIRNTQDCFSEPGSTNSLSDSDTVVKKEAANKALSEMSAKSRKISTRKFLLKNSPLITPSSANKRSKKTSVALEFECDSISSSQSSMFTDNETNITRKKRTGQTKKVRNIQDCFNEPGNTHGVLDSDTVVKKESANKALSQIPLTSRTTKKKRKNIFTLPDIISLQSDANDTADNATDKRIHKKRIRYTQDLNALSDKRDSDIAVKVKSKKTKKSRLPSYLPPVDMIEENKKLDGIKLSGNSLAASDDKENDTNTESTDTDEHIRKIKRGIPKKAKRKVAKNQENVTLDCSEEAIAGKSTNNSKDSIFQTERECIVKSNEINTNVPRKSVSQQPALESRYSKNENGWTVSERNLKETAAKCVNSHEQFIKNVSDDMASNLSGTSAKPENSQLMESRRSTRIGLSNRTIQSTFNQESLNAVSERNRSTASSKTPRRVSSTINKRSKSESVPSLESLDDLSYLNSRSSTRAFNAVSKISAFDIAATSKTPELRKESTFEIDSVNLKDSFKLNANRKSHEQLIENVSDDDMASNLSGNFTKPENSQLMESRRSTRIGLSNRTIQSISNQESLNAVSEGNISTASSKTPRRVSSTINKRSKSESVPSLESLDDLSYLNSRSSTRAFNAVSKISAFDITATGKTSELRRESTFEIDSVNLKDSFKQNANRKSHEHYEQLIENVIDDYMASNLSGNFTKLENSQFISSPRSTRMGLSNSTIQSISNLESLNAVSERNISTASSKTPRKVSSTINKGSKSESAPNLETLDDLTYLSSRSSTKASNAVTKISAFDITASGKTPELRRDSTFEIDSVNLEDSFKHNARRKSHKQLIENVSDDDMASNLSGNLTKLENSQLIKSRRSTRIGLSNSTIQSSNLESLHAVPERNISTASSKTPRRVSSTINKGSKSESVPNLESLDDLSRASNAVSKISAFDITATGKTPELRRENTFEIHSVNLEDQFKQNANGKSVEKDLSMRETIDKVPPSKYRKTRGSNKLSSYENHGKNEVVIDLTESVTEDSESSTDKEERSTFGKDAIDKRKSSFEVSFRTKKNKKNPEEILDHLNITRLDSRKSSFKKSNKSLKYSTGSEDEAIGNFVTLRRGCRTMIDFDTENSSEDSNGTGSGKGDLKKFKNLENLNRDETGDKSVLLDKSSPDTTKAVKKSVSKKSILKKSIRGSTRGTRRDTFEIAECLYETLESLKQFSQAKPAVSLIGEATPNVTLDQEPQRDIFDVVARTPTGKMMIGSGESVIVGHSFLNDTNMSGTSRLTRASTFTKNEEEKTTPPPARKSTRKRWSQVERTPIFTRVPNSGSSIATDQQPDQTLEFSVNKSKSVTIKTPPNFSPARRWNNSLKTTSREPRTAGKGKKSVKIETPVKTPKIRLHSPLIVRKTPGPDFGLADDSSILAGNCAYKPSKLSPPSKTSTPYPKKKEISLLQKVLTCEKNKSGRSVGKNSVRSKMPNFAKIHQRQYEKMENLKEMQERKAVRAQYLLSGTKPLANTSASRAEEKESRKQLKFSPKKMELNSSKAVKVSTAKPLSKPLQHMLNKRVSLEKKKKEVKSKVPVAIPKPVVPAGVGAKASAKSQSKGFTRFGFKLPSGKENITREEQIKAVSTKSKITVNRTETNRNKLVGVRSNRRFELLMKMRGSKK